MPKESWIYTFEAYAGGLVARHNIPGLSVGLARHGATVYAQGFGFRNVAEGLPCTPTTVHGIGSITKSMTCVAILQLQERGKLKVTDPVLKYLPEFRTPDPEHTKKITIHHFMTHSAGLPPLPTLFPAMGRSFRNDPNKKSFPLTVDVAQFADINTYEELMAHIARTELKILGEPGARFSYSNDGFGLLGCIIERVSGMSYAHFIEENLLKPAGMADSTFDLDKLLSHPETTMLYGANPEKQGAVEAQPGWWQAPAHLAAGFLRSTVPDMLRYMEIYRTGGMVGSERILSRESVAAMTRPQIQAMPGAWYGYGLLVYPEYHGVSIIEHSGGIKGVSAQIACVPEKGITGVALTNVAGAPSPTILHGAINAMLGLPLDTRRVVYPDAACDAQQLADYVGEYKSLEGSSVTVAVEEGQLAVTMQGSKLNSRCIGEDAFAVQMPAEEAPLVFLRDASSKVDAVAAGSRIVSKVS
ncbi:MAG: penicillin-binding protein [Firmicutes bacterium]|nr:penicillin-binding protein [Bacillota bacterium]